MTPTTHVGRKPPKKSPPSQPAAPALYLYAISQASKRAAPAIAAKGIDGASGVEGVRCQDYFCWVSRVSKDDFADHLAERMENLEWLASTGLRHQRAVAEIASKVSALPARFGTVFLSEESLELHVKERKPALRAAFERVAGADEWGIKIFALAKPRVPAAATKAASGADYLRRKAQLLQPRAGKKLDEEVREFVSALAELAVAASPGGKASAGQPGLLWHGSFLIRRSDRRKLDAMLKKYAAAWKDVRRIDCSGPWPPYSFVEEHAQ
jgi:hypothetical protein